MLRAGRTGNRGKTFSKAIRSEKAALATQYGAMSGLGELGTEVRHSVRQYAQRRLLSVWCQSGLGELGTEVRHSVRQ